jgi:hypothetical protein
MMLKAAISLVDTHLVQAARMDREFLCQQIEMTEEALTELRDLLGRADELLARIAAGCSD